jgi:3-hydroxyisobutyrate dehydrogenase-like beta-hydroxyacid dehydrogenase
VREECAEVCAPRHCAGDELDQPLPVAAAANEAYKRAKAAGLGDADFAAVYEAVTQRKKA